MQPVSTNARDALAIYVDPNSEHWERDCAALLIGGLEEGR